MKVIYDCSLRDWMLQEDPIILETVIPELTAYRALLKIRDIIDTKVNERKKEIEKAEREGRKVVHFSEHQGSEEETKKMTATEE